MDINYLIIAHRNPNQLLRLVERLSAKDCYFYIHIDKVINSKPFEQALKHLPQIKFVSELERVSSKWCDIGTVNATLALLNLAINDNRNGYCVLLSGQDYPIKTNAIIRDFFESQNGIDFISSFPLPDPIWAGNGMWRLEHYKINLSAKKGDLFVIPSIYEPEFYYYKTFVKIVLTFFRGKGKALFKIFKKRIHPTYLKPYGGDTWWSISMSSIKKIMAYLDQHSDLLKYHEDTFCPDETLFHSILNQIKEKENIKLNPTTTFANWKRMEDYKASIFSSYRLPGIIKFEDFESLKAEAANQLFARKFDLDQDEKILDKIDEELLNQ